jgi:hypothetical protein
MQRKRFTEEQMMRILHDAEIVGNRPRRLCPA